MFQVKMKGNSFALDPLEEEHSIFSATKINPKIWKKRLGYFNHAVVVKLQKRELVKGLPHLETKILDCKACQLGKQVRLLFKQTT